MPFSVLKRSLVLLRVWFRDWKDYVGCLCISLTYLYFRSKRLKKNKFSFCIFACLLNKFLTLDKNNPFFYSRFIEIFVPLHHD